MVAETTIQQKKLNDSDDDTKIVVKTSTISNKDVIVKIIHSNNDFSLAHVNAEALKKAIDNATNVIDTEVPF
jgi:hypothetical protein